MAWHWLRQCSYPETHWQSQWHTSASLQGYRSAARRGKLVGVLHAPDRPAAMYNRDALHKLIRTQALKFGKFTLASGKEASYYLDCRQVTLDSSAAPLIGAGMIELLPDPWPELVGGMVIGADPITAAILTVAGSQDAALRGVMVRKEPKGHGTKKFVEGPYNEGERIVIVEDVVTTGGSSLKAIEHCEAVGLKVEGVLAIVDRLEGGREAFSATGYELKSLFTVSDFGIEVE